MADETLDRRGFFRRFSPSRLEEDLSRAERATTKYLRPPGVVDPKQFAARCTACGDCVEACPEAAIFVLETNDGNDGTPVMAPDERACAMCDGFPCAQACPEDALVVPESTDWNFGTVRIAREHCFTFRGPECGACHGLCPTDDPALRLDGKHPVIDADACIGCGLCIDACPTRPAAIELVRTSGYGGPAAESTPEGT